MQTQRLKSCASGMARRRKKGGRIARSADAMERRVGERRSAAENAGTYSNRSTSRWRPNPDDRRHPSEGG